MRFVSSGAPLALVCLLCVGASSLGWAPLSWAEETSDESVDESSEKVDERAEEPRQKDKEDKGDKAADSAAEPSDEAAPKAAPPSARTEAKERPEAPSPTAHEHAYCEMVEARADAEKSLLYAPELVAWGFGRGLYGDFPLGPEDSLRGHLLVGLQFDFSDLYRASLTGNQAELGCRRYLAKSRFERSLSFAEQHGQREALRIKLALLEEAIPHANKVVDGLKKAVAGRRASDRDLRAMQFRLAALIRLTQETRYELEQLPARSDKDVSQKPLHELLEAYQRADAEYEKARARLSQSNAWHVSLAAGYSQDFGWESEAPVFAGGNISFDLGRLWQGKHVDRALQAQDEWQRTKPGGPSGEYHALMRAAQTAKRATSEQLRANGVILADLEARLERLAPLNSQEAAAYRNLVWFDYAELLAQTAAEASRLSAAREFLAAEGAPEDNRDAHKALEAGGEEAEDAEALAAGDDEVDALLEQEFALRFKPKPLPAEERLPSAEEVLEHLTEYDPRNFYIVLGDAELKGEKSKQFDIEEAKTRFEFPGSDGRAVRVQFTYGGMSESTAAFASGKSRSQLGIKLRAKDSCNVLYIMWRIEPEQRVVVSKKSNPGQRLARECGNNGYEDIAPDSITHPPVVQEGRTHTFDAYLAEDNKLQVFVDNKPIWEGDVGQLGFDGPSGVRTDNALFEDVTVFTNQRE